MATPFSVYQGNWWRFSKYELRDGDIRPAPKAELEVYDPWAAYHASWDYDPDSATPFSEQRASAPPYQSLLTLFHEFRFDAMGEPDPESVEKLLAWCAEHGLLGILPQRTQMVTLATRYYPEYSWKAIIGMQPKHIKDGVLKVTQFQYFRHNAYTYLRGWFPIRIMHEEFEAGHQIGEICKDKSETRPGVLIQDFSPVRYEEIMNTGISPIYYEERLSETWGSFFPDVPEAEKETFLYPLPLSDRFWHLYAERVQDFLAGAVVLAKAVNYLNYNDGGKRIYEGMSLLNSLVSTASMMLIPAGDSFVQEWRAPSLLTCMAIMALQDLTQQRKVLNCENCQKPFVTDAYQARYCSDTCRRTAQKRRYRQRLKEKESK